MNKEDLLLQINALPLEDRLELLEALKHSLREKNKPIRRPVPVEEISGIAKPKSPASELGGILKIDSVPSTDEEIREDYINYLSEKYS